MFVRRFFCGFFMVICCFACGIYVDTFVLDLTKALITDTEARGISTPSRPLFLGFHKQRDNRNMVLEEIRSFRKQGDEVDNGEMYVGGHTEASDDRDEVEPVTDK